jgi:hypothetical protein
LIFFGFFERFSNRFRKSPIQQQDPTVPLISVEKFNKSVENLKLACGNTVECLGKSRRKDKNCKGGIAKENGALGIEDF